ncbi:MAG: TonB-dependent receptor [Saprospiraceae bacterium]|nr:TonB-dependent receptor [Saprospiraceae bacterium]
MYIPLALVFLFFYQISVKAQTVLPDEVLVTYQCYNKPLKQVLKDLAALTNVSIVYSENKIPANKPVFVKASKESLGDVLTVVLNEVDLKYQIVGNQIVIVKTNLRNLDNYYTISGYIRDALSKEYLISATAFLSDYSSGTYTNEYGFFSMKLPRALNRVQFSYLGYKSNAIELYLSQDTIVEIFMVPEQMVLNEVLVSENNETFQTETPANQYILPINKINKGNHLMGESDAFRYISMLPGVSTGADGIGGLNIRGGSYDQNLILLDGIPLYNPGHALGIFSVFNASSIKNVQLVKGAFPARYGGRLSSVLDVQTKDGNMEKTSGEVSMSLIALKAGIEGPIIKNKLSYHLSFRRTFLDVWVKELAGFIGQESGTESSANYFFYDLNGKINWRINQKNRIILNAYNGKDKFVNSSAFSSENVRDNNNAELGWGNSLFSLRWSSQWSDKTFSKWTLYSTGYDVQSFKRYSFQQFQANDTLQDFWAYLFDSSINEKGVKFEIDWIPSTPHYFKFGVGAFERSFSPGTINVNRFDNPELVDAPVSLVFLRDKIRFAEGKFYEINAYAEDEWNFNEFMGFQFGVHSSALFWDDQKKPYFSVQPRLAFLAKNEPLVFKLGISNMMQYVHLLSNNGLGLPTDIWLGANKDLPPQTSWIFSSSLKYNINNSHHFGIEMYYKRFQDLTNFKEGEPVNINAEVNWEEFVPRGKGEAYGIEVFYEKTSGKTNILASYTYSISNRLFPDINVGNSFPFGFNRIHNFKCSVYRKLSEFSEFSVNWTYGSGNYYSKPENVILDINGKVVLLYPEKNNATFNPYHRLDIGFGFYNKFSWGKTKLFIGLYNAYNQRNFFYADVARNRRDPQKFEINQFSLLPLTPNISYTVSF